MSAASDQIRHSVARASLRWRHTILLAAILAFSASLLVGLVRLVDENRKAGMVSQQLIFWSASQLSLEYWRFLNSFDLYAAGVGGVTKDDLVTRLDVLWSRVSVYEGGAVGKQLTNVEGAAEIVSRFAATLKSVEADLLALEPADTQAFERVHAALSAHAQPLFKLGQNTNLYEQGLAISFRDATGRTFWVLTAFLLGIVVTGSVLIFLLISEARTTTRTLRTARASERRARSGEANISAIMSTAGDAIVTTDPRGIILSFNAAAESMFDRKAEEAIGRDVAILIPDAYQNAHHEKMRNYAEGNKDGGRDLTGKLRELEALRRDGSTFPIELSLGVTDGDEGRTHVAFVRDITARQQSQQQIHHSQKMDALGQLTGGVAHEFNNLLTAISGFSEMARRNPGDSDKVDYCLTEVINASAQAAELTKQMLAFARKEELNPQVVNVDEVVKNLHPMLKPLLGSEINLKLDIGADAAWAKIDPSQLNTAVMNLAINACHAMPGGGDLMIGTSVEDADSQLASRYSVEEGKPYVAVFVADTGTGIEKSVLDRMFEPFFTTKEEGKGTGLGLAMVHGTAEQAKGFLDVETEIDVGTTFTIYLPLHEAAAEASSRSAGNAATGLRAGDVTVLIAEDKKPVRELARMTLENAGYEVVTAEDGAKAADLYHELKGNVDLLLTDVIMPNKEGPELALELLADNPNLKVVYMSGFISREAMHEVIGKTGVFIQKPFDPDDLVRIVDESISGAADDREVA